MQFCVDYYNDLDTWHLEVQLTTPKREEGGWSGPGPRARWGWVKFLGIYKTRDAAKAAAARLGTAILPDEKLNWQEAVKSYCKDPVTSRIQGRVGYIKRDDVKFEETFRRQLFNDLGAKLIDSILLRGPIIGDNWIYLARLESVITRGVVELQLFRDEVQRSLVNRNLYAKLSELTSEVTRSILIPITL